MSAVTKGPAPSIKSITIIRQDALPDAGPAVQSALRLARFAQSVALLVTPQPTPDKFFADITTSQTHQFEWDWTDNPVENGATITDHVRRIPAVLDVEGLIVDTPLFPPTPFTANRAQANWQKLLSFANERNLVFVATSLRIYPNMGIMSLTVSRDVTSGGSIPVSISLKEIFISSTTTAQNKLDEAAAAAGALPITNGGTLPLG